MVCILIYAAANLDADLSEFSLFPVSLDSVARLYDGFGIKVGLPLLFETAGLLAALLLLALLAWGALLCTLVPAHLLLAASGIGAAPLLHLLFHGF